MATQAALSNLRANLKSILPYNSKLTPPRQTWVESFLGTEPKKLDILELHPRVFGVFPRFDHVTRVVQWQRKYRSVNYLCMPTRNELPGGKEKPRPQKGTGRARQGSVNSPIYLKGGWARGPRGPTTQFSILPHPLIVSGMINALTMKLAQDDIKVVPSIEGYEPEGPDQLEEDLEKRRWGPSVLILDDTERFPDPLFNASRDLTHINLMNLPEFNVLSLIKHETLIVTQEALRKVEEKLIFQLIRADLSSVSKPVGETHRME